MKFPVLFSALLLLFARPSVAQVDFVRDVRPIFVKNCYSCHGETKQKSGLRLDVKAAAMTGGDRHGPDIVPGKAKESPLIRFLTTEDEDEMMPPKGRLDAKDIATLTAWIDQGAMWPDGVDVAKVADKSNHWSYKPLTKPAPPPVKDKAWPRGEIDRFVLARLEIEGLQPSKEAGRAAWLRRVTFDLTGLPPTTEQVAAFERDARGDAHERVVDELLSSKRYGERWAQHWLDVVRYADTHGFEVNTERPNAWHYRDYVIDAFNADTPYDRFIKEQIVGDALGTDAATGFLVTASVLLPAQVGKDEPSKRLARQDALDEIVNNVGQTFLGLSIGCARCHDHKFDPITAKDYYAMQAFVAGVAYGDREMRGPAAEARNKEIAAHNEQVKRIGERLAGFVPLAQPATKRRATDAKGNTETFAPLEAKFVRFTIHDANLHPQHGLIEPCLDELEIFSDGPNPQNVALAAHGTKVTASGSNNSTQHKLEHVNDGKFGNPRSWMSSTKGRGWVMFELPQATRISKVVWSRDREGRLSDRLPTAFTLQAGLSPDKLVTLAEVSTLRPSVVAGPWNTDRFAPVRAKSLLFEIQNTNNLEPCLDEIEVFNSAGQNIALAAKVTTSGNTIEANRHDPNFLNDGQFGNERSWLGNERAKGWVELEFPAEHEITRVQWSRDRLGKKSDRLATEYKIAVRVGDDWKTVADSSDRRPFVAGEKRSAEFALAGLSDDEAQEAERLLAEKSALEAKIKAVEAGRMAFAGVFRKPDEIRLLNRGDPEQPKEEVPPAVISALGNQVLTVQTPEQERRKALAEWIASPQNPLTARVMVNRIWQGHFGSGLVPTPSDFGNNGVKPSHPELLDWLAGEFIRSGWSIKHLHRLIVLSQTYGQSSASNPAAAAKDSDVRLLWRYPAQRLEAEAIRDTMLTVSGQLDLKMYGRGYDLFRQRGGLTGFDPVESFSGDGLRRMIYAHKVRRESEAVFGAFDCPDAGQSAAVRRVSTTPIQALNLLNSRFTLERAEAFAARLKKEAGEGHAAQIQRAYQLALGRNPSPAELADAEPIVRQHGLATLGRALFNSNEFLFLP